MNRIWPRSLACSAIAVSLLLMRVYPEVLASPVGSPFEAAGRLEFSSFRSSQSYSTEFYAIIDDNQIIIRTRGFGDEPLGFCEFGSTGTNSWRLEKFSDTFLVSNRAQLPGGQPLPPQLARLNAPLETAQRPRNAANLYIKDSPTPTMIGAATPVWLAFAARRYLDTQFKGEYLSDSSIFLLAPPNSAHQVKDRAYWRWSDENPRFLKSLSSLRSDSRPRAPAEHTNAVFNVLAWTNVAGVNVPSRFELSLFIPERSGVPALAAKMRGTTERFQLLATNLGNIFPVQFDYSVGITDQRVIVGAEGGPFRHFAKDGRVPTLDEAKALAAKIADISPRKTRSHAEWRRPGLVRIAFFGGVALLSGFLLVTFLRGRKERSVNTQQREI